MYGYHADPIAVGRAIKLIDSLNIIRPEEIDIELIAAYCGAYVTNRVLPHEEGHLLRTADRGIIVVNSTAYQSERWRFTIGHELGHFLLHRKFDQFFWSFRVECG